MTRLKGLRQAIRHGLLLGTLQFTVACGGGSGAGSASVAPPAPGPITHPLSAQVAAAELTDKFAGVNVSGEHHRATAMVRLALTAGAPGVTARRERCNAIAARVGRREVATLLFAVTAGASLDALATFTPELRLEVLQAAIALGLTDPACGDFRRDLEARMWRELGFARVSLAENLDLANVLKRVFHGSAVNDADVLQVLAVAEDQRLGRLLDLFVPALDEMVRSTEDGVSARNPATVAAAMCRMRALIALGDHTIEAGGASAMGLFGSIWRGIKSVGSTALQTATSLMTGGGLTGVISAARNVVGTISSVVGGVKSLVGGGGVPRITIDWPNGEAQTERMLNAMERLMRQTKGEILARLAHQDAKLIQISQRLSDLYDRMEQRFAEMARLIGELNRNLGERLRELAQRLDELQENVRQFVADNLAELAAEIEERFTQVVFQAMSNALVQIQAKIAGLRADHDRNSVQRTVAELSSLIIGSAQSVLLFAYAPSELEQDLGKHCKSLLPFWSVVAPEVFASGIGVGNTILATLGARPVAIANPVALTLPSIELAQALSTSEFFATAAERAEAVRELLQAMETARINLNAMFSNGLQLVTARLEDLLPAAEREWRELVRAVYRPKIEVTDRLLFDRWLADGTLDAASGYARLSLNREAASFASGRGPLTYMVNNEGPYVLRAHDPVKKLVQLGLLRVAPAQNGVSPLVWDVGDLPGMRDYTGTLGSVRLLAAGADLEVHLEVSGVSPIQLLAAAERALGLYELDFADIVRQRIDGAGLRNVRALFSMQSATRLLLELARDTFVADAPTRVRIVALLERPLIFSETLGSLLGVNPRAALSWSLYVKGLLSAQVGRLLGRELDLHYLDDFLAALRPAVTDLRADAVSLARAIESSPTVLDYGTEALRAWVAGGGLGLSVVSLDKRLGGSSR